MTWTPKIGLVLKHKTIHQQVEIIDKLELPGMVMWEVWEVGSHSVVKDKPWLIHEPWLVEQYEPKEDK